MRSDQRRPIRSNLEYYSGRFNTVGRRPRSLSLIRIFFVRRNLHWYSQAITDESIRQCYVAIVFSLSIDATNRIRTIVARFRFALEIYAERHRSIATFHCFNCS